MKFPKQYLDCRHAFTVISSKWRYLHPFSKDFWELFVLFFPCAFLPNVVRENTAMEVSVDNFSIMGTLLPEQTEKRWQNWAIHFLVLQFGQSKSCRCKSCVGVTNLAVWALWRWNSVILIIHQQYLLPLQLSREPSLGFQHVTPWVRVWSVLERSHSLSNLGNWHFIQAGIR